MSFQPITADDTVISEINMTPLVDVMLVLLIIFIITVPVINHAVNLNLPRASSQPNDLKPSHVTLSIDAAGGLRWDETVLSESQLAARISEAAARQPQPELHLRADRATRYEKIAQVMSVAQGAGLSKIGFVTEPLQGR